MSIASAQTSGVKFAAVVVCQVCSEILKFYHLHFSAVKCTNCENILSIEEIKSQTKDNSS